MEICYINHGKRKKSNLFKGVAFYNKQNVILMGLKHAWRFMIRLFDFQNLDSTIRDEIPKGRGRYGIPNYGAGIMMFLFTLFMLTTLALVYFGFLYDALSDSYFVVTTKPELTYGFVISSIIYFGLIMFPYFFVGSLIYQGLLFGLVKIMGGKGKLNKQYYVTSYIALALGLGSLGFIIVSILGVFLPCLNVFFFLIYLAAAIYLVFFAQTKMLMILHHSKALPIIVAIFITSIGSVLAFIGIQLLVGHFGLFPDFTATFSIEGIRGDIMDIGIPVVGEGEINATNITNTTGN
jgi:hypothetical protein